MPVYEYEHRIEPCPLGKVMEIEQAIHDEGPHPLSQLRGVQPSKLISLCYINTPRGDSEIRDKGFTKLVKRDSGVYENVTARNGDSRFVHLDNPKTLPNLRKTIRDSQALFHRPE